MTFFSHPFVFKAPNLPKRILKYIRKIKARQKSQDLEANSYTR